MTKLNISAEVLKEIAALQHIECVLHDGKDTDLQIAVSPSFAKDIGAYCPPAASPMLRVKTCEDAGQILIGVAACDGQICSYAPYMSDTFSRQETEAMRPLADAIAGLLLGNRQEHGKETAQE